MKCTIPTTHSAASYPPRCNLQCWLIVALFSMAFVSPLGRLLLVISIVQLVANADSEPTKNGALNEANVKLAVIVFACSRPSHLRRTLRSLAAQDSTILSEVDIYVSVDAHRKSRYVVNAAQSESDSLELPLRGLWEHPGGTPDVQLSSREKITAHYGRSIRRLFKENPSVTHAVILEDDIILSPDFLAFLAAHAPYTSMNPNEGPTAISGWNDNSAAKIPSVPSDATALTDFFPGLGWLLSRQLWGFLDPIWPDRRDNAPVMHVGAPTRVYPAARAAPTGWDWWLRAEYEAQKWIVLYPLLGRVSHHGGASGATNVAVAQQKSLYETFKTADGDSALSYPEWVRASRGSTTRYPAIFRAALEELVRNAKHLPNVEYAKRRGVRNGVYRIAFTEMQYPSLARELALWPAPRAFFAGRLALKLSDGITVVLERTTTLATRLEPAILAQRNESCYEACSAHGGGCIPSATTAWNNCTRLAQRFGCQNGCIYETGEDIPAIVADDAPISTAGSCVVTEITDKLSCTGSIASSISSDENEQPGISATVRHWWYRGHGRRGPPPAAVATTSTSPGLTTISQAELAQIKATCLAKLGQVSYIPPHVKARFIKRCAKKLKKELMLTKLKKMSTADQEKALAKLAAEKKARKEKRIAEKMKHWPQYKIDRYKAKQERKRVREERLRAKIQEIMKNAASKTPDALAAARRKATCESTLQDRAKLWSQARKDRLVLRCMKIMERDEFKKKLLLMSPPERLAQLKLRADRKIAERKRKQAERMRTWPQWKIDRYNKKQERMKKHAAAVNAKRAAMLNYIAQHGGPPPPGFFGHSRPRGHRHFGRGPHHRHPHRRYLH